jgi:hypothetical protein
MLDDWCLTSDWKKAKVYLDYVDHQLLKTAKIFNILVLSAGNWYNPGQETMI